MMVTIFVRIDPLMMKGENPTERTRLYVKDRVTSDGTKSSLFIQCQDHRHQMNHTHMLLRKYTRFLFNFYLIQKKTVFGCLEYFSQQGVYFLYANGNCETNGLIYVF